MRNNIDEKENLASLIQLYKKVMGDMKVSCVGIITTFQDGYANIQPILRETYATGEVKELPLLTNVLCLGDEPEIGDLALIVFNDKRHLLKDYAYVKDTPFENYLIDGKKNETRHSLNNGIAICGFSNKFTSYQRKFIQTNWEILRTLILNNGGVEPSEN